MNTTTQMTTSFDAEALRRSIEERDAETLLALYAEDAELHVVDCQDQPSHPKIIRGRAAIGEYYADVCGRDMTHTIERLVVGGTGAAFVQVCQYPGGARDRLDVLRPAPSRLEDQAPDVAAADVQQLDPAVGELADLVCLREVAVLCRCHVRAPTRPTPARRTAG